MQCLASQDKVELMMLEKQMDLPKAIDGTRLNKLERELGDITMVKIVTYLLMRFSEGFNVKNKLTPEQAAQTAIDIIEKYPYETIEDILLLLKQVRQGLIGDGKDYKLDGQNILNKWFPEYLDKKYIEVERQQKQTQYNNSNDDEPHPVTVFYEKRRKEKLQKEKDDLMKKEIDEMLKNMDRQMLEDTIVDWERKEELKQWVGYLKSKRMIFR